MIIENLAVGVVTYNRLDLLKKVIEGLRNQSLKPHAIFVVNNSSTDGTTEWLETQSDLTVFTQANTGSSGGQYKSILEMYRNGYEWMWIMDDDVCPAEDCLENLFAMRNEKTITVPLRIGTNGKVYYNDTLKFNFANPFKSIWAKILSENDINETKIEADGVTFEGLFFNRSLITDIGLPDQDFFIYADDTEFLIRANRAGYKSFIIKDAILNRMLTPPDDEHIFTWKHYYVLRNIMVVDILYGNIFIKIFRPFLYTLVWLFRSKSIDNLKTVLRAFKDAYLYKQKNLKVGND
ncbi:MAG: glycosyltransferase [bacterium]